MRHLSPIIIGNVHQTNTHICDLRGNLADFRLQGSVNFKMNPIELILSTPTMDYSLNFSLIVLLIVVDELIFQLAAIKRQF